MTNIEIQNLAIRYNVLMGCAVVQINAAYDLNKPLSDQNIKHLKSHNFWVQRKYDGVWVKQNRKNVLLRNGDIYLKSYKFEE